jgi:FdhD protein
VPVLAAVPKPSSLAVELAEQAGVALVGFLRGLTMTFYSHGRRVRTRARPAHETVAGSKRVGIRATTGWSRARPNTSIDLYAARGSS